MKQIEQLLEAFEMYYSPPERKITYGPAQRAEIITRYIWIGQVFKLALYDEVLTRHPSSSRRALPDVAVISAAMKTMNPPETYETPQKHQYLPEPDAEDFEERIQAALHEAAGKKDPDVITGHYDEVNHFDRQRVRERAKHNDATKYELFWLRVIDEFNGDWGKAVASGNAIKTA